MQQALAERAVRVALSAIDTVPGLFGYVGVDVVLSDACDWVIEINPRLTTSYLGLRALAEDNLAEMMVRVARGENVEAPRWKDEVVRFSVDGINDAASRSCSLFRARCDSERETVNRAAEGEKSQIS